MRARTRPRRHEGRGPSPRARTPSIIVRPATPDDAPVIAAMRLELLREEGRSPLFATPRADAATQASRLTARQLRAPQDREVILLASLRSRPIGVLRCVLGPGSALVQRGRYAVVTTVYVAPVARRRGVLTSLLLAADAWCRDQHIAEMRLHCTVENTGGDAAWRALGFRPAQILHRRAVPPA